MNVNVSSDFFLECLANNPATLPLAIEKSIVAAAGPSSVLSTDDLDLAEYAQLGHCTRQIRLDPRPDTTWRWGGEDADQLFAQHTQAIWDVSWRGQLIVVIELAWSTSCGTETRYWVVAGDSEVGREFLLDVARKTNDPGEALLVFSGGCWRRSRELYQVTAAASFDDLVLAGELKESIRHDFARFLAARSRYEALGLAWRRGALFTGPPGNGKTHCLRALVRELRIPSLYVQSLKHPHYPSEYMMEAVFDRARQLRPCVLIFEDLDALITPANRSYFLNQLDGFQKNVGLIVIATTNHPERIDPAIVDRPSRFDRKYHFTLPGPKERAQYLQMWQQKLASETGWNADEISPVVAVTGEFSFAYLKELIVSSLLQWMSESHQPFAAILQDQVRQLRLQMATGRDFSESPAIPNPEEESEPVDLSVEAQD